MNRKGSVRCLRFVYDGEKPSWHLQYSGKPKLPTSKFVPIKKQISYAKVGETYSLGKNLSAKISRSKSGYRLIVEHKGEILKSELIYSDVNNDAVVSLA